MRFYASRGGGGESLPIGSDEGGGRVESVFVE